MTDGEYVNTLVPGATRSGAPNHTQCTPNQSRPQPHLLPVEGTLTPLVAATSYCLRRPLPKSFSFLSVEALALSLPTTYDPLACQRPVVGRHHGGLILSATSLIVDHHPIVSLFQFMRPRRIGVQLVPPSLGNNHSCSSNRSTNASSSITGMSWLRASSSFDPAPGPATT